eukprot:1160950-Pelagomonas_calceolata.AAC.1
MHIPQGLKRRKEVATARSLLDLMQQLAHIASKVGWHGYQVVVGGGAMWAHWPSQPHAAAGTHHIQGGVAR